ncbi:hypothetical protein B0H14DRAFT_2347763, partial [Mycena olivaceomarginata]
ASMPWFKEWTKETRDGVVRGKTLLDAIDATIPPVRPHLRLPYLVRGGLGQVHLDQRRGRSKSEQTKMNSRFLHEDKTPVTQEKIHRVPFY